MSEPQQTRPPGAADADQQTNGQGAYSPAPAPLDASDLFLDPAAEPTDDTPTIISKALPAPPSETFSGSLRGRSLAHFELIEPIGVGGMAAVLRARDRQLDRIVALKILPPEMAADPENVKRFHQEARAAARLDHENIARVFFCGEDQRLHFIAFEFVEGENLRTLLERRGRLPVAETVHYMLQIATGLDHAASRGVVHRDIKPSNIIISPTGRAKLVDMGLARSLAPQGEKALTQSGVTLGTFDYISPEQALEPRDADARSDIYSLGCTFYHTLTGQAPVPEGTAAKKLHHHQHVPPVDPRQLNPEVPDSVAAILARMMAKDPKDRYQRPEHLVQHLLQVAQEIGSSEDVPQGVLFVDAPLPNPPRPRPGRMALLGTGGLVAVVAFLSFVPTGTTPVAKDFSGIVSRDRKPPTGDSPPPRPAERPPATQADPFAVKNEGQLKTALAEGQRGTHIKLQKDIDLGPAGLTLQAPGDLTLESENAEKPAVVRFLCNPDGSQTETLAGLTVDGGRVTFHNLRFEVQTGKTPEVAVAAVLVRNAAFVTFEKCVFVQQAPLEPFISVRKLVPVASVVAENAEDAADRPKVILQECFFQTGQTAIALNGAADVRPTNCAFGPHGALFHLRGVGRPFSDLSLNHCSAFLVHGPAFRLDRDTTCRLSVQQSIFSCPESDIPESKRDQLHLIAQTDNSEPAIVYLGKRNCYHNLNAFWVRPLSSSKQDEGSRIVLWEDFRKELKASPGAEDDSSSYLTTAAKGPTPWASPNPLQEVLGRQPRLAFQVNPSLPELRQLDYASKAPARKALGVENCVWGSTYDRELPELSPVMPPLVAQQEKIVDPSAPGGGGVYQRVSAAIADAKDGDVILIRHNGTLPVSPVRLEGDLSVTLKPYKDCRPVLTLAGRTDEVEASLFRLSHGQLMFERLAFELEPDRKEFQSQSVVTVTGNGYCDFKDCLITLKTAKDPRLSEVRLSVLTLLDARDGKNMPHPEPRAVPRLVLNNCFVRGEGDFLAVPHSRPLQLEMSNALVTLSGSFLAINGNAADPPASDAVTKIKLTRVTTYLAEHLVQLMDKKSGKGLVFTGIEASDGLFAGANGKALIQLDGLDSKEQMQRLFDWKGKHNAYSGFEQLLDQPESIFGIRIRMDSLEWRMFANENDPEPRFVKAKFDFEPLRERSLSQLLPSEFRLKSPQWQGYGANLDQLNASLQGVASGE